MPDVDAPIHPLCNEPVALLDIAKAAVAIAGFIGLDLAEDRVLEAVVGINAIVLLVAATLATRRRVTPETRAVDRERQAYTDGLEIGAQQAPAQAKVFQVAEPADADREWVVPRYPPAPPAPPADQPGEHGRAGLLDRVDLP